MKKKIVLKTSLDHLPFNHQQDLAFIKDTILKYIPAEMIIPFGSYARGDYVIDVSEEDGTLYEYTSDYDIMIITAKHANNQGQAWHVMENKILKRATPIPTSLFNHTIGFVNEQIEYSQYFFLDMIKEGIMLHDSGKYELTVPRELLPAEKLKKEKEDFEYWMGKGNECLIDFRSILERKNYPKAAFELHQATESCYAAFSLVFTGYKPKTHDLLALRKRAIKINPAQKEVFPMKTKEKRHRFDLLRRGYVDARYKKDYKITPEELQYLHGRIEHQFELSEKLCKEDMARKERNLI